MGMVEPANNGGGPSSSCLGHSPEDKSRRERGGVVQSRADVTGREVRVMGSLQLRSLRTCSIAFYQQLSAAQERCAVFLFCLAKA